jgi:ABC-type transport system substrate-binding protein
MMRLNRILVLTFIAALVTIALTRQSTAQTAPLPFGQVTVTFQMNSCPASFYQGSGTNPAVCYGANVSCPAANPVGLTFSYINGNAPNAPIGTIVLFNSGGGEMTMMDNNDSMASDYATAKYAVVQTSWATDWENTDDGLTMTAPPSCAEHSQRGLSAGYLS